MTLVRALVSLFFRRLQVTGLEHVPPQGGGLLVAWHPNGLVDPALILACFPRPIAFGARHGLFRWPLLGALMRSLGTVPIHRASDAHDGSEQQRREQNRRSLDALAAAIAGGSFAALFPEGVSHDAPHLMQLKVGAARLYYRALELSPADQPAPCIIPVGLHYDEKAVFRSEALVAFHPPLVLPPQLARPEPELAPALEHARHTQLIALIERALSDVVHPTESWELHRLMHRTRSLARAERASRARAAPGPSDMRERALGFGRVWQGYEARRRSDPEQTERLIARIAAYDRELHALGIEDEHLDRSPRLASPTLPLLVLLQAVLVYLLLPPLLVAGYAINAAPYLLLKLIARLGAGAQKDVATIKLLGGLLLFPLAWGLAAGLVALGVIDLHARFPAVPEAPLTAAMFTLSLGAIGGVIALRYLELTTQTWRALLIALVRRRYRLAVEHLRLERAALHDELQAMAEGLPLPGQVAADGRVM